MQIDWISGFIECPNWARQGIQMYDTGQILSRDPDGEVKRIGTGKVLHEGSHDSRLMVISSMGHNLYLSGNPVKHIQGHNLFGSDDAVGLFLDAGLRVRESMGLFPSPATFTANEFTPPRFTRLDVTRSYRFPSTAHAREWLRTVASTARTRHGSALLNGDTVYYGKGSTRWTFKIYSKFDELHASKKGHALSSALSERAQVQLLAWSEGVVRFELTLRSEELQTYGGESGKFDSASVWENYYGRIKFNRNAEMKNPDLFESSYPKHLRLALFEWRSGADLRKMYSKTTFYRIRRELLDCSKIDIASPPLPESIKPAAVIADSSGLDPARWDPEPIEEHFYHPDARVKNSYGLL